MIRFLLRIGITTFKERYSIFRLLVRRLVYAFPHTEIIVTINGHHDCDAQKRYLREILRFCEQYPQINVISFIASQGLSKLWNQIILSSSNERVLILNDDLLFKKDLQRKIRISGILNEEIALIDNSFSHFLINKSIVRRVGWFDERFTEIGGEDDDFHVRLVMEHIPLKRYNLYAFKSYKPSLKINSYGRRSCSEDGGYSTANTIFLLSKWEVSRFPFKEAVNIEKSQGSYWQLREGMDTPNFYDIK